MKLKTLIATLAILGSSTAAMADTVTVSTDATLRFGDGPVVRDHRYDDEKSWRHRDRFDDKDRLYHPPQRARWIALDGPINNGRGRDVIQVDPRLRLDSVRIQIDSGATYVSSVIVRFEDGTRQHVVLDQWLSPRDRYLQFELDKKRPVDKIIVLGTNRRGSYKVFGFGREITAMQSPSPWPRPRY